MVIGLSSLDALEHIKVALLAKLGFDQLTKDIRTHGQAFANRHSGKQFLIQTGPNDRNKWKPFTHIFIETPSMPPDISGVTAIPEKQYSGSAILKSLKFTDPDNKKRDNHLKDVDKRQCFSIADKEALDAFLTWYADFERSEDDRQATESPQKFDEDAGQWEDATSDDVFAEGKEVTETHVRRERDPKLRKSLLKQRRNCGRLTCDVCGRDSSDHSPHLGEAVFEAHHIVPLAAGQERKTQLKDMALLCANCHRMVHRAIAQAKRWLTIDEAKAEILRKANP